MVLWYCRRMDTLGILFGSLARVKLMRHFLMNPDKRFTVKELSIRSKISLSTLRKELNQFKKAGLIKDTTVTVVNSRGTSKKVKGVTLNASFPHSQSLADLILENSTLNRNALVKKLKQTGKLKLLVLSGILTGTSDSRLDVLIVGKDIEPKKVDRALREVEAEIGRELAYAVFDTDDFIYRMNMYDKLIADVLDYPHERLIDVLPISTRRSIN